MFPMFRMLTILASWTVGKLYFETFQSLWLTNIVSYLFLYFWATMHWRNNTEKHSWCSLWFYRDINGVSQIHMEAKRWYVEVSIRNLVARDLIIVGGEGCVVMQDLLRDMGRVVVKAKCGKIMEKQSRIWMPYSLIEFENEKICFLSQSKLMCVSVNRLIVSPK